MVASALSAGADTSTRLAPAVRCAAALSRAVKMPVHSSAISTPRSFHGSFVGSRSAETFILPLPRLIESPSTVTVPGKRPCTESKRSRCALVSTGPRSLIPTTSISLRPDSAMARRMLRPMRPNPLMATRTVMFLSPDPDASWPAKGAKHCLAPEVPAIPRFARIYRQWKTWMPGIKPSTTENGTLDALVSLLGQLAQRRLGNLFGRNAEVLVEILKWGAGAEARHADKRAVRSDDRIPALAHGR